MNVQVDVVQQLQQVSSQAVRKAAGAACNGGTPLLKEHTCTVREPP